MLYLPRTGHMWDPSIVYHDGVYYLFSMYCRDGQECVNVWCASSTDGVHFTDFGIVIEDQPVPVWKMFVNRYHDAFIMNHGSFSGVPGHGNDTLRFFQSQDLVNWRYCGTGCDLHPDPRWYCEQERFDHMYTLEYNAKWYGYVVATPIPGGVSSGCGLMESVDGLHWKPLPPPVIEWGDVPPTNFEVGGCEQVEGKFYLIGGTAGYCGNAGYSVYTFEAEHPVGPFRPCMPRYRLCGSSRADDFSGVQWLASFGRGAHDEILLTNYMTAQSSDSVNFIGTRQKVWLLPIKKAVRGPKQELAMGYWPNNELLKGKRLSELSGKVELNAADGKLPGLSDQKGNRHVVQWWTDCPENGLVVEGRVRVSGGKRLNAARFGFLLGNEKQSTLLSLPVEDERFANAEIRRIENLAFEQSRLLDELDMYCAGVHSFTKDREHFFRLFCRKGMFELYVDELLVQSYVMDDQASVQCGFYLLNGQAWIDHLGAYEMTL